MKKIIIRSILALVVLASSVLSGSLASAQTTTTTQTNTSKRCTVSQARLNARISKIDAIKVTQAGVYDALEEKIATVTASAKTSGYDVVALEKASTNVKAKITVYKDKVTAYQTALLATKNLSCGNSDGEYATSLTASRAALVAVRTASADVRATIRSEAIPAIKEYASWIKDQTTTTEAKK